MIQLQPLNSIIVHTKFGWEIGKDRADIRHEGICLYLPESEKEAFIESNDSVDTSILKRTHNHAPKIILLMSGENLRQRRQEKEAVLSAIAVFVFAGFVFSSRVFFRTISWSLVEVAGQRSGEPWMNAEKPAWLTRIWIDSWSDWWVQCKEHVLAGMVMLMMNRMSETGSLQVQLSSWEGSWGTLMWQPSRQMKIASFQDISLQVHILSGKHSKRVLKDISPLRLSVTDQCGGVFNKCLQAIFRMVEIYMKSPCIRSYSSIVFALFLLLLLLFHI